MIAEILELDISAYLGRIRVFIGFGRPKELGKLYRF
jgi:hypothetical protein